MFTINERYVVNADGSKIGVFLDMADYRKLTHRLAQLEILALLQKELRITLAPKSDDDLLPDPSMPLEELRSSMKHAFDEAGYDTHEKIIELVRDVKRELADERNTKKG